MVFTIKFTEEFYLDVPQRPIFSLYRVLSPAYIIILKNNPDAIQSKLELFKDAPRFYVILKLKFVTLHKISKTS